MKQALGLVAWMLLSVPLAAWEIDTNWAYHSAGDEARLTDTVPGVESTFLAGGSTRISSADPITLYVMTSHNFAGEMEESVHVRWWDGARPHWIMGTWMANRVLEAGPEGGQFRGHPQEGAVTVDLWKVDIPPWVTQPGWNFYAIQLRGTQEEVTEERYLLSRTGGGFSRTNRLGQAWSASEEFDGQDWNLEILP